MEIGYYPLFIRDYVQRFKDIYLQTNCLIMLYAHITRFLKRQTITFSSVKYTAIRYTHLCVHYTVMYFCLEILRMQKI